MSAIGAGESRAGAVLAFVQNCGMVQRGTYREDPTGRKITADVYLFVSFGNDRSVKSIGQMRGWVSGNTDGAPTGVDQALRDRVMEQIAIVQDALDDAVANPTDSGLNELFEATDRLMRALARVLLEIERQRSLP
jgi:hypothetical protein